MLLDPRKNLSLREAAQIAGVSHMTISRMQTVNK